MVKFDELRISENGEYLTIECRIEDYDVYSDMYIDTIYLEYYKNRGTIGVPSEKALKVFENTRQDKNAVKHVRVRLCLTQLPGNFGTSDFRNGLFYVYVNSDGNLPAAVAGMGCGYDVNLDVAVIPDWKMLYEKIMPLVAKYASGCTPCDDISGFGHLILMWYAFKYAVETCDWVTVDRLWGEFVGDAAGAVSRGGCGCFSY
jgi:hypothetical protein